MSLSRRAYRGLAVGGVVSLAVIASGVLAISLVGGGSRPASHVSASSPTGTSIAISRDEAIARVSSLRAEVPQGATLTAKLLLWGDIRAAQSNSPFVASLNDNQEVWAVSIEGGFTPSFARGEKYAWGVVLIDPTTGDEAAEIGGNNGARASWFDNLQDKASGSS
jgi:hypothetical protein